VTDPLRVLVIGAAANVWQFHAPALDAIGAQVVAVFDPNRSGARRIASERGCALADDIDDLLAHDADLAVILAPHVHHPDLTLAALDSGCHVLVEKPMAVTIGDAERMVAAAERTGKLLAVAVQQRTRHEVLAAKRLIDAGDLGELRRIDLLATWPRRTSYFETAPWRATWSGEGGGILMNQGQHDLDLLCWLAGPPATLVATTSNVMHGREVEDTAVALLHWRNGATGALRISSAERDERQRIEITGTRGRIRLTPGRLEVERSALDFREYAAADGNPYAAPAATAPEVVDGGGGTHVELYRNLAGALNGEEALIAPGADAAAAVELANAIVTSAQLRKEVDLPIERERYARLLEEFQQRHALSSITDA
jgi:predicted dehydrogenase